MDVFAVANLTLYASGSLKQRAKSRNVLLVFVVYLGHVLSRHKADPKLKKGTATLVPRVYKHGHINLMLVLPTSQPTGILMKMPPSIATVRYNLAKGHLHLRPANNVFK
ncbi:hypothetical protein WA026_014657 [Henosepilachna vigintioctopunctata]|uniref:Uncharacterized protein n=1 Tax=Henosepilachna vigintioctopunctata TaxID=420089 RepID=A0AAW1VCP5_9CUCU